MKFAELPKESKERARKALRSSLGNSYLGSEEDAGIAGKAVSAAFIAMESYDGAPDVCGDKATVTDSNGVECGRAGPNFHVGDSVGTFDEAAKPLIKWLAENVHPHHTAVVTSTSAELLEGKCSLSTTEYLRD
ncbi:TPA: hypothetical protein KEY88_005310 [Serratia marcescens]|nr:hypothetical protein [Serratia marcescens]